MYCPQCATANPGDVKFCRSCGTALEAVALALSGKGSKPAEGKKKSDLTEEDWLEKRIAGVSSITRGAILLGVSLLLAIPLGLFLPATFDAPWILIWVVFFGWMAVWGGIDIASGISNVLESKSRLRLQTMTRREVAVETTTQGLLSGGEPILPTNAPVSRSSSPVSVTEGTTRHLND
ncbi:MAG TPA: zinc ribbon domain-containing protein [Pyrinomonadaceae bacterium]